MKPLRMTAYVVRSLLGRLLVWCGLLLADAGIYILPEKKP